MKKEYIAIGYLSQGDVDKLIEVFMRAIRNGNMTIEEMELIGEREGWFMRNPEYDKKKEYIAIGYLNQGDVDKLIEVFMRAIRNGNMTIEEMELIGEREGWFMHNSKYDKENNKAK